MANKRKRRRRRNRGHAGTLLRLISVVLSAVVIVAALTLFFKVEQVVVSGQMRYTEEEIVEISGVLPGDNLILLDKYMIARNIYTELPYITDVVVNRSFPDTLVLEVTETRGAFAVDSGGVWWLVSDGGKLLEAVSDERAQESIVLRGVTMPEAAVGAYVKFDENGNLTTQRLLDIASTLSERGMLEKANYLDTSDPRKLVMGYDNRFAVEMFYDADLEFSFNCLEAVVEKLQPNETGIIRMTMDNKDEVRFIPYTEE
ncbi:MAG: FtsQ-type POTRA domain-containing protein [Oscillospiraceae bacterium]|nr:FtsQ-type POTRA domain-containing protein [Oscillospiraceae bacterium]